MQCNQPAVFSIFKGDAKTMMLKAVYAGTGNPLDLTSCTEIVVNLPLAIGGFLQKKLSLSQVSITSPAVLGQFTCPISAVDSATLNLGELQNVDVTFTIGSTVMTVAFQQALSVFEVN